MNRIYRRALSLGLAVTLLGGSVSFAAPSEIHGHMPVSILDYYLELYNDKGEIRVKPETTSFNLVETEKPMDPRVPELVSGNTEYGNDVVINVQGGTEQKEWFKNVYKVAKVPTLGNPNNQELIVFDFDDDALILNSGSPTIDFNGRHQVMIYSNGYDPVVHTIHIVKDSPNILLSSGEPKAYAPVILELDNYNYAIENPIRALYVDGVKLEECTVDAAADWHIVSDIVRIHENVITEPGQHTIKMEFDGFKASEIVLNFGEGEPWPEEDDHESIEETSAVSITPDLLAAASGVISVGGSDGESGSTGGGGRAIDTNVIFDFDLISNAMILREAGLETPESKAVIDVWEAAIIDSGKMEGSERRVDWAEYQTAAEKAKSEGEYLKFEDYYNSPESVDDPNRPSKVKYVLQDGNLGSAVYFSNVDLKPAPALTFDNSNFKFGDDVVLQFESSDWADSIEYVKVDNMVVKAALFDKKLVIGNMYFAGGETTIKVFAKDYHDATYELNIEKTEVDVNIERVKSGNDALVKGLTADFISKLTHISLNGEGLNSNSGTGDHGDYRVDGGHIILNKSNILIPNDYSLTLNANGYNEINVRFTVDESDGTTTEKVTPTAPENAVVDLNEDFSIDLENVNDGWLTVEKTMVLKSDDHITTTELNGTDYVISDDTLSIGKGKFRSDHHTLVISAVGYKTIEIDLTVGKGMAVTPILANTVHGIVLGIDDVNKTQLENNKLNVTINGNKLANDQFNVKFNELFIPAVGLGSGTSFEIELSQEGHLPKTINVAMNDSGSSQNVTSQIKTQKVANVLGKSTLAMTIDDKAWVHGITEIKIDDSAIDFADSLSFDGSTLKIEDIRCDYGSHQIEIKSEGFKPYTSTFNAVKESINLTYKTIGDKYVRKDLVLVPRGYVSDFTGWVESVTNVKIDGESMSDFALVDGNLVIDGYKFLETKAYEILIESSEYADSVFTTNELLSEKTYGGDGFENSYYHTENIVFESNDWIDGVTEIKVTPDGGSAYTIDLSMISKLVKDSDTIINGLAIKNPGNNTIEVKSEGYEVYSKTVMFHNPKMAPEGVKLSESNTLSTKEAIAITIPNVFAPSYTVYEVQVDGVKLNSDQYTADSSNVVINTGVVAAGTHEITLKANGYQDKAISVDIIDSGVDQSKKDAPEIISTNEILVGSEITLNFTPKELWVESITGVYLTDLDKNLGKDYITYGDGTLLLPNSASSTAKEYTLVIKSDGFEDVSFKYSVLNTLPSYSVGGNKFIGSEVLVENGNSFSNNFSKWAEAVKSNGSVKIGSGSVSLDQITVLDDKLILPGSAFDKLGLTSIVIEVNGYKTMSESVDITEVQSIEPQAVSVSDSIKFGDSVYINNSGNADKFIEWANKSLIVKVDGHIVDESKITKSTGRWSSKNIKIDDSAFSGSGQYVITIEAPGYNTLTKSVQINSINAGQLGLKDGHNPKLGEDVVLVETSYSSNFKKWLEQDLVVSVNGNPVHSGKITRKSVVSWPEKESLTIDGSAFIVPGQYDIEITAPNYNNESITITIEVATVSVTSGGAIQ